MYLKNDSELYNNSWLNSTQYFSLKQFYFYYKVRRELACMILLK